MRRLVVELRGVKPGAKGNSKNIMRFGNRIRLVSSDKDKAKEENLVALLHHHPLRPSAPLEGQLRLDMTALMPIAASWSKKKQAQARAGTLRPTGRPDRGNMLKLAEDALEQAGWLKDDSMVVEGDVAKRYDDVPGWRFVLTVLEPLSPEDRCVICGAHETEEERNEHLGRCGACWRDFVQGAPG